MAGRYYQTTPIYYVNDKPHIGTAYTTVMADILSRWHRLAGDETLFLTGTDEHGLKIMRTAEEHGMSPQAWSDVTSARFVEAWRSIEISNDDFIRTTEARHRTTVQAFMTAIHENGHLYKGTYEGWYCVSCEAYYQEDDLVSGGLCPVHERPVEWFTEENWFFRLSSFEGKLLEFYDEHPDAIFPESRRNEALGIIKGGLKDVSITRTSIDWGIKVPWDEEHVFYVWYDALVNYISAIGYGRDEALFSTWWPAVHHMLAKDIIRFHCVWWPSMCMAAGIDPPRHFIVHGYLLVGGRKMGKTAFNMIDPVELADDVGNDALRYYLARDFPLGPDGDFSYEGLIERYNSDLANNLGNLLARVATVVASKCGGIGPAPRPAGSSVLARAAESAVGDAVSAYGRAAPHEALEAVWRLIRAANAELEAVEPWKLDPGPEVEAVLGDSLEVLRLAAILVSPVLLEAPRVVWSRLGLEGTPAQPREGDGAAVLSWGGYPAGRTVEKGAPLFPRRRVESE